MFKNIKYSKGVCCISFSGWNASSLDPLQFDVTYDSGLYRQRG